MIMMSRDAGDVMVESTVLGKLAATSPGAEIDSVVISTVRRDSSFREELKC